MRSKKPIIFLILGITLLFFAQLFQQEDLDWRETYSLEEKIPFSSYVFYDLLDEIFPGQKILPSYNSFYLAADSTDFQGSNWIFVNSDFRPEATDVNKMMRYVEAGNSILISAGFIGGSLADSLNLKHRFELKANDTVSLKLTDQQFKEIPHYDIDKIYLYHYFASYDSANWQVLGTDDSSKTNFIKIEHGRGFFLLHSVPRIFTNYHILKGKSLQYLSAVISYLPVRRTIWDEYYKESRVEMKSPLRFVFNRNALRWAYYTALVTLVLFMIFAARRKQRIIPVIPPPKNDTLDFVQTVGRLYHQHSDHKNLLDKKITFFLEDLRSTLYINDEPFSEAFIKRVSSKTELEPEKIQTFFEEMQKIQKKEIIHEKDLLHINSLIEDFNKEIKLTGS